MPNKPHVLPQARQYSGYLLCENLTLLMEECHVTLGELHRNTGIPIATIQRIKTEPRCNPTISTLQPIADFFSLTIGQLIGDESLPLERTKGAYTQKKDNWIKVPIISWEQAVTWPNVAISRKGFTTSTDIDIGNNTFALHIAEDDWIGFQKDSIIIVDPNLVPENRDYIVVQKSGFQTATLKKFLCEDGIAYLAPLNDNFKIAILNEDYRILGVIRQIRKDLQTK